MMHMLLKHDVNNREFKRILQFIWSQVTDGNFISTFCGLSRTFSTVCITLSKHKAVICYFFYFCYFVISFSFQFDVIPGMQSIIECVACSKAYVTMLFSTFSSIQSLISYANLLNLRYQSQNLGYNIGQFFA